MGHITDIKNKIRNGMSKSTIFQSILMKYRNTIDITQKWKTNVQQLISRLYKKFSNNQTRHKSIGSKSSRQSTKRRSISY